jgi:hypothetical protein
MRYTEPRIIRNDEAILAIQSVGLPNTQKPSQFTQDNYVGGIRTTPLAYEADE